MSARSHPQNVPHGRKPGNSSGSASATPVITLPVVAFSSPLHNPETVGVQTKKLMQHLTGDGLEPRLVKPDSVSAGDDPAYLILTGGTENLAMSAILQRPGPFLLLAHPENNSLPAAIEILAGLRQNGRQGRIFLIHDPREVRTRMKRFLRLAGARRTLGTMRLGLVGRPSDWLTASMVDPRWVTRRWGPEVVLLDMSEMLDRVEHLTPEEVKGLAREFSLGAKAIREPTEADLTASGKFYLALRDMARSQGLHGLSLRCFDLVNRYKQTGCLALARLTDEGCLGGCEGDLPALLTMAWLKAVTGEAPFMANPQDLDPEQNQLWLAHCTIPRSWLKSFVLRSHFESGVGVGIQGRIESGPITMARIGGRRLEEIMLFEGHLLDGEELETRCRTQIRVSLKGRVQELLENPLGNHQVLIRGAWREDLEEYLRLFSPDSRGERPCQGDDGRDSGFGYT